MSDDAYKGSNPTDQANNLNPFDNFTNTTSQDGLDRWWNAVYEGIKRTNVVIEKVPLINMDEARKANLVAQACYLRGMFYFDLVRGFGGVPLVLDTNPPLTLGRRNGRGSTRSHSGRSELRRSVLAGTSRP
jgi:hypothetical protein